MATINTGLGGPQGVGEGSFLGTPLTSGNYDDGSIAINITSVFGAGGIDYFGTSYTTIYINTNGLITFAAPQASYTPSALGSLTYPAIAPFWSDVDIRAGSATGTNNIYWDLDPASGKVTITWLGVRAYSGGGTNTNTFQLVLENIGSGNFEAEFIYQQVRWTNGGSGIAQTGLTNGGAIDYVLPGSGNATSLLGYPNANLHTGDPAGTWSQHFWNGVPVCFAAGTLIATPTGPRRVESLRPGDLVDTLDDGPQPLRWVGGWQSLMAGVALPVCIAAGTFGNSRALRVSGLHLILLEGAECELLFGEAEVLVAAKDLVGLPGVTLETRPQVISYHHLLLDRHQILLAEGAPAESLHPGPMTLENLPLRQVAALQQTLPPWELDQMSRQPAARRVLRGSEARVLRAQRLRRRVSHNDPHLAIAA